jgi:hypothetical protein
MTFNSKKNIIGMAAGIIAVTAYIIYICVGNAPATEDIKAWAKLLLVFIGIGVAAQIVIQILFYVIFSIGVAVKENDGDGEKTKKIIRASTFEDERNSLINLKTLRIGYTCAGIGLLATLIALAFGAAFVVALHIAVGAGALASLVEGCAGIFFHERGVRNG